MDKVIFFKTQKDLRKWFEKNHETEKELFLGYYKVHTKKPTVTWSQSVDEAICFGWIDGIRKSIDDESYQNRFTPRKPNSNWSAINIDKYNKLLSLGLVHKKGKEAFGKKKDEKSQTYSYERVHAKLTKEYEDEIKKNKTAWEYFNNLAPGYKKISIHWVMSAKLIETQKKRLNILIESCEQNLRIPLLRS